MTARAWVALAALLILAGAALLLAALLAPRPFLGIVVGPMLIACGVIILDERDAQARRRARARCGLLDAHDPDVYRRLRG